jgi:hypothetical protein
VAGRDIGGKGIGFDGFAGMGGIGGGTGADTISGAETASSPSDETGILPSTVGAGSEVMKGFGSDEAEGAPAEGVGGVTGLRSGNICFDKSLFQGVLFGSILCVITNK